MKIQIIILAILALIASSAANLHSQFVRDSYVKSKGKGPFAFIKAKQKGRN